MNEISARLQLPTLCEVQYDYEEMFGAFEPEISEDFVFTLYNNASARTYRSLFDAASFGDELNSHKYVLDTGASRSLDPFEHVWRYPLLRRATQANTMTSENSKITFHDLSHQNTQLHLKVKQKLRENQENYYQLFALTRSQLTAESFEKAKTINDFSELKSFRRQSTSIVANNNNNRRDGQQSNNANATATTTTTSNYYTTSTTLTTAAASNDSRNRSQLDRSGTSFRAPQKESTQLSNTSTQSTNLTLKRTKTDLSKSSSIANASASVLTTTTTTNNRQNSLTSLKRQSMTNQIAMSIDEEPPMTTSIVETKPIELVSPSAHLEYINLSRQSQMIPKYKSKLVKLKPLEKKLKERTFKHVDNEVPKKQPRIVQEKSVMLKLPKQKEKKKSDVPVVVEKKKKVDTIEQQVEEARAVEAAKQPKRIHVPKVVKPPQKVVETYRPTQVKPALTRNVRMEREEKKNLKMGTVYVNEQEDDESDLEIKQAERSLNTSREDASPPFTRQIPVETPVIVQRPQGATKEKRKKMEKLTVISPIKPETIEMRDEPHDIDFNASAEIEIKSPVKVIEPTPRTPPPGTDTPVEFYEIKPIESMVQPRPKDPLHEKKQQGSKNVKANAYKERKKGDRRPKNAKIDVNSLEIRAKRPVKFRDDADNEAESEEEMLDLTDDWLMRWSIVRDSQRVACQKAFGLYDAHGRGRLSGDALVNAIRSVCPLDNLHMNYLLSVMSLCEVNPFTEGASLQLFAIMVSLAQRVKCLDSDWFQNVLPKLNMASVENKVFKVKNLWNHLVDRQSKTLCIEDVLTEFEAGGVTHEHVMFARDKFSTKTHFDLMDYLTYIPLFVYMHDHIVENPFDQEQFI